MILSEPKELKEILRLLKEQDIFIIGCGKCAAKLHVGGEDEVLEMKKRLTSAGKTIVGWTVLSTACSIPSWDEVLSENPEIQAAQALLVMSCGGGVSVVSRAANLQVYPALNTRSLGGICGNDLLSEQCGMCGECMIWMFGGICPVIQCSKGLLNGPCGGAVEGQCEVDERPCPWDKIVDKLRKTGNLQLLEILHEPRDHSKKKGRQNI